MTEMNRLERGALAVCAAFIFVAAAAPLLMPYDPNFVDMGHVLEYPSARYLLGTDPLGRDVLSRLISGARVSIGFAAAAAFCTMTVGLVVGTVSGYVGGRVDALIQTVVNVFQGIPSFSLMIALAGLLEPGVTSMLIAVVVTSWTGFSRVVRGEVIRIKGESFVEGLRALGAGAGFIVGRYVLRSLLPVVIVLFTIRIGMVILSVSGLSYIGIGLQPPTSDWGLMVSEGQTYFRCFSMRRARAYLSCALRSTSSARACSGALPGVRGARCRGGTVMQEMNSEDIVLQELSVSFPYEQGLVLHPVDCTFPAREITAVIGESGSGKSVLGKAIVGLLSRAAVTGRILYDGQNLAQLGEAELRAYRGRHIFFMPQDPALALNPALTIGEQLTEALEYHEGTAPGAARRRAIAELERYGFDDAARIFDAYAFSLSGGMRQRVLCAIASLMRPQWIIADEPTKGLDPGLRKQVFALFRRLAETQNCGFIIISHDLRFVRRISGRTVVLRDGRLVEQGTTELLFTQPQADYTRTLAAAAEAFAREGGAA